MKNTFTSHIKSQLTNAGFSVIKDFKEKQWIVLDGNKEIMYNSSLGQLMSKAASAYYRVPWISERIHFYRFNLETKSLAEYYADFENGNLIRYGEMI